MYTIDMFRHGPELCTTLECAHGDMTIPEIERLRKSHFGTTLLENNKPEKEPINTSGSGQDAPGSSLRSRWMASGWLLVSRTKW